MTDLIEKPYPSELYPDFYRLAKDLRPVVVDFEEGGSKNGWTDVGQTAIVLSKANAVTSEVRNPEDKDDEHKVVLDLDMDAALIPSTTPGHHHLILNHSMNWHDYTFLLMALEKVGIIESGFAKASIDRGASVIRTPWTKKEKAECATSSTDAGANLF